MATMFFVCLLCLLLPVESDNVKGTQKKVMCLAGEFNFTEYQHKALEAVEAPSKILLRMDITSMEMCRGACCEYEGCNVASFVSLGDDNVCALVACVDSFSCLWQYFENGVASRFLDKEINVGSASPQSASPQSASPQSASPQSATQNTTQTTQTNETSTANTPEGPSSTPPADDTVTTSSWMWPWERPHSTDKPESQSNGGNAVLALLLGGITDTDGVPVPNAPPNVGVGSADVIKNAPSNGDESNMNPPEPSNINPENSMNPQEVETQPPVFNRPQLPRDGIKGDQMGTSWQDAVPMEMPAEDNTTYTVGLAVFLASLGLAGVLVLTIHFISKSRQKSRYSLLEVEEEKFNDGDRQPFLPK